MTKITYASDFHFEFPEHYMDFKNQEHGGDVLILAGDILTAAYLSEYRTDADSRSLKKYLRYRLGLQLFSKYKKVFYVMGNHEHYGFIYKRTAAALKAALQDYNIQLLDCDWVDYDGKIFVGATLWSDFEKASPISMMDCGQFMNDYRLIGSLDTDDMNYFNRYTSRRIMPEFTLSEHNRHKAYIGEIAKLFAGKKELVVITHHCPSLQSLNKQYSGNGLDGAYASDLTDMICGYPNIKYWFHGHTHFDVDYMIGDHCRVLANQRGYSGQNQYHRFQLKTIEI